MGRLTHRPQTDHRMGGVEALNPKPTMNHREQGGGGGVDTMGERREGGSVTAGAFTPKPLNP